VVNDGMWQVPQESLENWQEGVCYIVRHGKIMQFIYEKQSNCSEVAPPVSRTLLMPVTSTAYTQFKAAACPNNPALGRQCMEAHTHACAWQR